MFWGTDNIPWDILGYSQHWHEYRNIWNIFHDGILLVSQNIVTDLNNVMPNFISVLESILARAGHHCDLIQLPLFFKKLCKTTWDLHLKSYVWPGSEYHVTMTWQDFGLYVYSAILLQCLWYMRDSVTCPILRHMLGLYWWNQQTSP